MEEGLLSRGPVLAGVMAHRDRALGAVEVIVKVGVVLQLAEVGQAVDVGPAVVAPGGPGVVVLGRAANEGLAVDGAGAAHSLAARDRHRPLFGGGGAGEGPVVGGASSAGFEVHGAPAELEHVGELGEIGEVGAGLQQQHGPLGVLGEPCGDDAAGSTTADNDVVVFHGIPPVGMRG